MENTEEYLRREFTARYGGQPQSVRLYYAPGRVNLIGEHIDYNGGKVFPCALTFGTYMAVRVREDRTLRFDSINIPIPVTSDLDHNEFRKEDSWANYLKGVLQEFLDRSFTLCGMDILVYGEIPNGSGLSSSASLEVLTATAVNDLFSCGLDMVTIAKLCQHSENTYNGVNCGIMDQFSVAMGRKDQAVLLDCATLEYEYVPLKLSVKNADGTVSDVSIVIGNTKKKRGLADSKYNERRAECEEALSDLQKELSIQALCDLTPEEFEAHKELIRRPICRRRAEHAVYENARVLEAVKVLGNGDLKAFGALMNQSHDSLRDLYEVTGRELDIMVEEARRIPGTLGSRMTGAGFGGCTVSLVLSDKVPEFMEKVGEAYERRTGLKPEFYIARAGKGAGRLDAPIEFLIEELIAYGMDQKLIEMPDCVYVRNQLLDLLGLPAPYHKMNGQLPCDEAFEAMRRDMQEAFPQGTDDLYTPAPVLNRILDYMASHGLLEENTTVYRDLADARIMGFFTARPSEVAHTFYALHEKSPQEASEYFYHLSRASHYIMDERIRRNLYWTTRTDYGDLEITINLSKPEKDPRLIAKMLSMKQTAKYPQCLLCAENVGYAGRLDHPARQNLREVPIKLQGEQWYLHYSPYTYYQEHCILTKGEHVPMKISDVTFRRLFQFVELLPHYFMGSNAGLPVVGGSILTHEHYQGGHHVFAMEKAAVRSRYADLSHRNVKVSIVNWPLSCIRLSSAEKEPLLEVAGHILHFWESYSDPSCFIYAQTNGTQHNAITPIARFNKDGEYELDMVLRNNITTEEYPDGVFHPHPELHHIKKENIGLIEVMGLAVLPGRLQKELGLIETLMLGGTEDSFTEEQKASLDKHRPWMAQMKQCYGLVGSRQEAQEILHREVGEIFCRVLEDAGVYKNTPEGITAFDKFMLAAGFSRL